MSDKILKFEASWCKPCQDLSRSLAANSDWLNQVARVEIEKIDIDEKPDTATKWGVRGVPTMIRLRADGTEVDRLTGNWPWSKLQNWFMK